MARSAVKKPATKVTKPAVKEQAPPPIGDNSKNYDPDFDVAPDESSAAFKKKKDGIIALAKKAMELKDTVTSLEDNVKVHKGDLQVLVTRTLPDAMAELGLPEFTTEDGIKISSDEFVSANLPKDEEKRRRGLQFLRENEAEDIIKTSFVIDFTMGDEKNINKTRKALQKLGVHFEENVGVHAQTLGAFAREAIRDGMKLPMDDLGIYVGKLCKITNVAENKRRKSSK